MIDEVFLHNDNRERSLMRLSKTLLRYDKFVFQLKKKDILVFLLNISIIFDNKNTRVDENSTIKNEFF